MAFNPDLNKQAQKATFSHKILKQLTLHRFSTVPQSVT